MGLKSASISEIKKELSHLNEVELLELCLKLAKYKKENKELLSYLIFDAQQELQFIENAKEEITLIFDQINTSNSYLAKKTIRKALKYVRKYAKYEGLASTEIILTSYFCKLILDSGLVLTQNTALHNLYLNQVKRIEKLIASLHEDFQGDFEEYLSDLI